MRVTHKRAVALMLALCILLPAARAAGPGGDLPVKLAVIGGPLDGDGVGTLAFSVQAAGARLQTANVVFSFDSTVIIPCDATTKAPMAGIADGEISAHTMFTPGASLAYGGVQWFVRPGRSGVSYSVYAAGGVDLSSDTVILRFHYKLAPGKTADDLNACTFRLETEYADGSILKDAFPLQSQAKALFLGLTDGTTAGYGDADGTDTVALTTLRFPGSDTKVPALVTVTAPANVTYGTVPGDPSAVQGAMMHGIDKGATFAYTYVGTGSTSYAASAVKPTEAGTYQVTATLVSNTHTGSATAAFSIAPASISALTPTVSGTAQVGNILTAALPGVANTGLTWAWSDGSSGSTLSLSAAHLDTVITVTAAASGNYTGTSLPSTAVTVQKAPLSGSLTISGNLTPDAMLTLNTSQLVGTATFVWLRNGNAIAGAQGTTYIITSADLGKTLSVRATGTGGYSGQLLSAAVAVPDASGPTGPTGPTGPSGPSGPPGGGGGTTPKVIINGTETATTAQGSIYIAAAPHTETVALTVQVSAMGDHALRLVTDFGSLLLPNGALRKLGGTVRLVVRRGSFIVALVDEAGNELAYYDPQHPLALSLPYTLGSGETAHSIVALRAGEILPLGVYRDGTVVLSIDRTGTYDVRSNHTPYRDTAAHWAADSIDFASARALFNGVGDGLFDPAGTMTRAMFVTVLARLEGIDFSADTAAVFSDVPSGQWYSAAVAWAAEREIVGGVGGGLFHPNATINREQMAAILHRYLSYKGSALPDVGSQGAFPDAADISPWASAAAAEMARTGLLRGQADGQFAPQSQATRAEASTVLHRLLLAMAG